MSCLADLLTPRLPAGIAIPRDLELGWTWMEAQGWGVDTPHGYFLTPYAGRRQLGVVFSASESLAGWFEEGDVGHDRLVPVAEVSGDGSVGVLWRDDADQVRFAVLGSDGDTFLLAENATDLLRLLAVGYGELAPPEFLLEAPDLDDPDEAESVAAHAELRAWVENELGAPVPAHWQRVEPDPFEAWVAGVRG